MRYLCLLLIAMAFCVSPTSSVASKTTYNASLSGREAVPPVDTRARGQAHFKVDGEVIRWRLTLANAGEVNAVVMGMAPAGQTGETVVLLYRRIVEPPTPQTSPGSQQPAAGNGVFGEGNITANRLWGPLEGGTIDDLVDAIRNGDIYISVYTEDGEIRGQIR